VADDESKDEPTLVERWLKDQQEWQKTALAYLDSMTKNEEFLVHMGNAMRGSLLAGKPYPTASSATPSTPEAATDDRIDEILHALHLIQGELQDLRMTLSELASSESNTPGSSGSSRGAAKRTKKKSTGRK